MKLFLGLLLVVGGIANASEKLQPDTSDVAAGISMIEKVQVLTDKQIESVKIASLADGPAANPVSIDIMLLSTNQEGDNASFDVYKIDGYFNDDARTAQIVGDFLVLTTIKAIPTNSAQGWKNVPTTLKIQIKQNGKRLDNPIQE